MEINLETISEFINLKRSKRFNLLVTVFSTIVSGFLLVLVLKPNYVKGSSTFVLLIFALAAVAPIYIFNQIISVFFVSKILREGLKRLISVAKFSETEEEAITEFTDDIVYKLTSNAFFDSPARQLSELITIVSCYIAALLSWSFGLGIFSLYLLLVLLSLILFFVTYKLISKLISEIKQQHFKPLIAKLRKDKEFMEHLESRLNNIENMIREKKEG